MHAAEFRNKPALSAELNLTDNIRIFSIKLDRACTKTKVISLANHNRRKQHS